MFRGNARLFYDVGVDEPELESDERARRSSIDETFPPDFTPKNVKEALEKAEIPHSAYVFDRVDDKVRNMEFGSKEFRDKVAFIFAYTFDNEESDPNKKEENPYRILNNALHRGTVIPLLQNRYFLWGLLVALRSLPYTKFDKLYRGLDRKVNWAKSDIRTWHTFTSMTLDEGVAKKFIQKCGGTLICGWGLHGYDISYYSIYKEESELLLEPFQRVRVKQVEERDGIVYVDVDDTGTTRYILDSKIPMGHVSAPPPIPDDVLTLMEQAKMKEQGFFLFRKTAIELYEKAGAKGCNVAYFNIGNLYMFGVIVDKDPKTGLEWWKKAGQVNMKDIWWMKTLSNEGLIEKKELDLWD